jgi:hypothetical protein
MGMIYARIGIMALSSTTEKIATANETVMIFDRNLPEDVICCCTVKSVVFPESFSALGPSLLTTWRRDGFCIAFLGSVEICVMFGTSGCSLHVDGSAGVSPNLACARLMSPESALVEPTISQPLRALDNDRALQDNRNFLIFSIKAPIDHSSRSESTRHTPSTATTHGLRSYPDQRRTCNGKPDYFQP